MIILLDFNVLLDVLAQREPHYRPSADVWETVESGRAKGLLAAQSLTTLRYLLARHTDDLQAATALQDVLRVFSVATVDQDVILQALSFGWHDF